MYSNKSAVRPGMVMSSQASTNPLNAQFQQAAQLHSQGQLGQAKTLCEKILQKQPDYVNGLHLLAVISIQSGALQAALDLFERALKLAPRDPALHCNQANAYAGLQQYESAIACYERAIGLQGGFIDAHYGLALALLKLNKFEEAFERFRSILAMRPGLPQAIAGQELALRCKATALADQGKPELAIHDFIRALAISETPESKLGFAKCARELAVESSNATFHALLVRAIAQAWTRPAHLAAVAYRVILLDADIRDCVSRAAAAWPRALSFDELFGSTGLHAVAGDPLLRCVLENTPVTSITFERFATQVRRVLLEYALGIDGSPNVDTERDLQHILPLLGAIAQQCFVNEYVFFVSDEEYDQLQTLRERIEDCHRERHLVQPIWVAAFAAYLPLSSLRTCEQLTASAANDAVRALVRQQVLEPAQERELRSTFARLTAIDDAVSVAVQGQYEQNPYPRWVRSISTTKPTSIEEVLRRQFDQAPIRPLPQDKVLQVLIAGCGTGQQPIEAAPLYHNAQILAIDLSLASLSYAKRKTLEIGLQGIEYANADILQLGTLHRQFDVIESVGVLHHTGDPLAAWRVLVDILRPGGLMRLGFYSEMARQCIVSARQFIAESGYQSDPDSIRRCRQEMMSSEQRGRFESVFSFKDFFSVSDCRDLLFHVQEQRYTIPQLKAALHDLGLNFLGFSVELPVIQQYLAMFPDDPARTNLDNWHVFETKHPNTFVSMYQFWVQKNP